MSPVTRILSRLLACWLLLTAAGCATLNLSNIDMRSRKATARDPVVNIVCLWEPAEGRDPKGVPCQGFAGRIMFINSSSLSVSVDGDVRVYLFDDKGKEEDEGKPLHQFDFDSGSWARHYSYGALGPAYNVFIPYMRRNVRDASCALRLRLKPQSGPVVFSDMTSIELLAIHHRKTRFKAPYTDSRVEEITPEDLTTTNKLRRTTTIVLNPQKGVASDSADPSSASTNRTQVQQAGYHPEDDVKPLTSNDARSAQLEQMVQELRALQVGRTTAAKGPSSNMTPSKEAAASFTTPPRRLDDEADEDHSRIRLRATKAMLEEQKPAAKDDSRDKFDASAKAPHRSKAESRMAADRGPRHPLDDTAPSVGNWTEKHPLYEPGVPVLSAGTPLSGGNRPAKPRHPLEDDQPVKAMESRKSSGANRATSQADPGRSGLFDPFDPIDTEAIER